MSGAGAQLVGGAGVGGAVSGGVGGIGATAQGTAGAAARLPDATSDVTRSVDRTDAAATRAADAGGKPVRVEAGASVRVARGSRCYYDDYYWDPVYRDGYYYCERTGRGVATAARIGR